jgi:uncharacterized tellurite resistance protein B-like protein/GTPase SAR1 family protein
MDTSLINSQSVELLSRITGKKLQQRDLTPPVIFLANLVTVLQGVILADGTVAEEEKQRLLKTLYKFSTPESRVRKLTHLMIKGVKENSVYAKKSNLQTLFAPLSPAERMLLIGFGYEISAADGDMDDREQTYLKFIANLLEIDTRYLAVLETVFSHQGNVEVSALKEVQSLLDPARFHELDTVFVKAANDLLTALPSLPEEKVTQQQQTSSYGQLKEFQKYRQQLNSFCDQLHKIVKDCTDSDFLPHTLIEEIGKVSKRLQSQRFRVAVVGEFSQGKSTLLNALLGEEIQPVRAIPCSGTISVLRYGSQKRIICNYKNGHSEEIPFEQYKTKAAISKEAALNHRTDELAKSELEEIIFEHPDLDLCKSGVEILDSPGLNEHPERTSITRKLLENTDAAIFLTNAMRLLPEKEKDLIQETRVLLTDGKENAPAENLFVLVNFMDSLDEEEDRQDVKQRLESFLKEQNLVSAAENRIHYISAKGALKAILQGHEDEYLKAFQGFTNSMEQFLTVERGSLEIKQFVSKIDNLVQSGLTGLQQAEDTLNGKIQLSESAKQEILEQIGEASGRNVKIKDLANQLHEEAYAEAIDSFNEWCEELGERMVGKSQRWRSNYSHIWDRDTLIQDYTEQFVRDIKKEIDNWGEKQLGKGILQPHLKVLEESIRQELKELQQNIRMLDKQINTNFAQETRFNIGGINEGDFDSGEFMGGLKIGGALAAGLFVFTGIGLIPIIIAGVVAAIFGGGIMGMLNGEEIHNKIKASVLEKGFEKFDESMDNFDEKIGEILYSAFLSRVEAAEEAIGKIISSYENLLAQQEKAHKQRVKERESEKVWISQKRQEIEDVKLGVEAVLRQAVN